MNYPKMPDFDNQINSLREYARLKHEYGAAGIEDVLEGVSASLAAAEAALRALPNDAALEAKEPNDLPSIRALRPGGIRKMWNGLDPSYAQKLEGALLARFAGCTLGAAVEGWSVESMEAWAEYCGDTFPPEDYWLRAKDPSHLRYGKSICEHYTRLGMNGVPADDDTAYTLLGLLIAEEFGPDFTTEDVGRAWVKYLPIACTAEEAALNNLKAGIPAARAADIGNPYEQWIGADIRSDAWAYIAPAYPEKAADMAYRDAYLSHRRNGIYGEMFFAAAQSAAFACGSAGEALEIGLQEIPEGCTLAKDIRWALDAAASVKDFRRARALVDERFAGMHAVHTNNNACLTVFGLILGGNDVTKVLSNTVAMGLDNDCTAATAGSIVGAITGADGLAPHWTRPFHQTVLSYLNGHESFEISGVLRRFSALALKVHQQ